MASGLIQPRRAAPDAWRNWIGQGFALLSRKWPAWIAVMSLCCGVAGAAGVAEPIGEYLTLALGFNLAMSVDHEPGWTGLWARFGGLLRGAVLFAVQVGMFVLLISIPLDTAIGLGELAAQLPADPPPAVPNLGGIYEAGAYHLVAWAMLLQVGLGFLYPLRAFGLGFHAALMQGRQAAVLNRRSILWVGGCSFASAALCIAFGLYPLIPLVHGFWMAVNYAMFRDIFLGVAENRPLPARVAAARQAAVLARAVSRAG